MVEAGAKQIKIADIKSDTERHDEVRAERDRLRAALTLIAAFQGKTLISERGDRSYEVGAYKAFDQCAGIARAALTARSS